MVDFRVKDGCCDDRRRLGLASEGEPEKGGTRLALGRWDWVEHSRNVICLSFNRPD